jgi:hypothetical protein
MKSRVDMQTILLITAVMKVLVGIKTIHTTNRAAVHPYTDRTICKNCSILK